MPSRSNDFTKALPEELVAQIFSYLSGPETGNIVACRLVNRTFYDQSSPYLIPQIVFARRLDTLSRFCQILDHPYFSQHVTELIYDASAYAGVTATDWERYIEDCERAPRYLEDEHWLERERHAASLRARLTLFCRDEVTPDSGGFRSLHGQSDVLSDITDESMTPGLVTRETLRAGYGRTFFDYQRRYNDQEWIRNEGIDNKTLSAAFVRLPKLRSIVVTDFRSLAHQGESYDTCCRRLFGKMLEPQHVGAGGETGIAGDCLFSILRTLANAPATRINGLAVGPHAFEYNVEDASELADPYHPRNPRYLDISAFEHVPLSPDSEIARTLNPLERLRLVLCYSGSRSNEEHMRGQLRQFIRSAAPLLRDLTLNMMYLFWGGRNEAPKVRDGARFGVFASVVMPIHMPYLRELSLRRWIFTADELKMFLSAHAATLRDMHLLGCLCGDDETSLAQWGGQALNLTGAELTGFHAVLDERSANPHGWQSVTYKQWTKMRPNIDELDTRHLESVWLGGRPNTVARQHKREEPPSSDWWK